ncbi:MAG TPA: hypothetical protein VEK38_01045, partial [Candidatus Bathyarchaeia archaeon]|nr:hypothetical protein [Candidatus Bathyarchaeia archaeon]
MHTIFLIIIFTTLPLFSSAAEKNTVLEFDFSTAPRYTPSLFNLCLQVIYSLKDTPEKEKIVKCEQIQEKWQKCCTDLEPWKKGYTFLPGNKENISFS